MSDCVKAISSNSISYQVTANSNVAAVVFDPQDFFEGRFVVNWRGVATRPTTTSDSYTNATCGQRMHLTPTQATYITSPGYPFGYASNLNCTWDVATDPGHHIVVSIMDINIEGRNDTCRYDTLKFFARTFGHWHLNRTLCGRYGESFELPSDNARIEFWTDAFVNGTGFKAQLMSLCGGELQVTGQPVELSTEHVHAATDCVWLLAARPGRTIQATFRLMDIQSSGQSCASAFLELRNGISADSPFLGSGRYCGSGMPTLPASSSNHLRVWFKAPHFVNARFTIHFEEVITGLLHDRMLTFAAAQVTVGCGGLITLSRDTPGANSYELKSPNWPNIPPHDVECDWSITAPAHTQIRFDFDLSQSPDHSVCNITHEYVEIYEGGTSMAPLLLRDCLPLHRSSLTTNDHVAFVRFATSGTFSYAAFKATGE